jgi:hypothetical protein
MKKCNRKKPLVKKKTNKMTFEAFKGKKLERKLKTALNIMECCDM